MKTKDLTKKAPNIILYGCAGTKKTALVTQAAGGYLMDFDDGMLTALRLKDKFTPLRQQIEFDTFLDPDPAKPQAWMNARKKMQSIIKEVQAGTWKYDAFIIDSLTGMAKCIQLYVMGNAGDPFKQPQIQHWGMMVREMEMMLTMLRALKVLKITTAHELSVDKDGTDFLYPKSMTKRHGIESIVWLFDECWYSSLRRGARGVVSFIVSGKPSAGHVCRTRSGLVEEVNQDEIGLKGILKKIGYEYEKF